MALRQAEELPIMQPAQSPRSNEADRLLDTGFIPELSHASSQHCRVVVPGQLLVRPVDVGIVAMGLLDGHLQIVADYGSRSRRQRMQRRAHVRQSSCVVSDPAPVQHNV